MCCVGACVCPAEAQLLSWGWRVPFLVASVSLGAGIILRYNMPESLEFKSNHNELDSEYHRRLLQQQAKKHQKQLRHQHQQAVSAESVGTDSTTVTVKDTAVSEPQHQGLRQSAGGSERAEEGWVDEAGACDGEGAGNSRRHYVPLLELFRGYWSGLVLHVAYAACKFNSRLLVDHGRGNSSECCICCLPSCTVKVCQDACCKACISSQHMSCFLQGTLPPSIWVTGEQPVFCIAVFPYTWHNSQARVAGSAVGCCPANLGVQHLQARLKHPKQSRCFEMWRTAVTAYGHGLRLDAPLSML